MFHYKGLKAVRERLMVTDAQLDKQMEALLAKRSRIIEVTDRASQADDEVVLSYAGEIDGEYFEGGTAEDQTLVLGSGSFIPGFEEQLLGKKIGEDVDVHVSFPEQYHAPKLAGKPAVFHCKIKGIRLRRKYEPDDLFAREVGGCESFEEFKAALREAMQQYADEQAENELKDKLLDQICEDASFEISSEQLEAALDLEMRALEMQLQRQGLSLELYCNFMNRTQQELRAEHMIDAKRNVERTLAVAKIAELEGIEADEKSIAAKLEEICVNSNMTIAELEGQIDEKFELAVQQDVITHKVMDFIIGHAEIETIIK